MTSKRISANSILDTALELAEVNGWEGLRLHDVAAHMEINLNQIRKYFSQKDDLVEAWFDRADSAMLKDAAAPDYVALLPQDRLHRSIMAWLNTLSAHREVTHQMLKYKFEIGHVHLQVLGLLRVSRTVQWFLEAAQRHSEHLRRIVEEVAVTSIYLATFAHWFRDESPQFEQTSDLLMRLLTRADVILRLGEEYQVSPDIYHEATQAQNQDPT